MRTATRWCRVRRRGAPGVRRDRRSTRPRRRGVRRRRPRRFRDPLHTNARLSARRPSILPGASPRAGSPMFLLTTLAYPCVARRCSASAPACSSIGRAGASCRPRCYRSLGAAALIARLAADDVSRRRLRRRRRTRWRASRRRGSCSAAGGWRRWQARGDAGLAARGAGRRLRDRARAGARRRPARRFSSYMALPDSAVHMMGADFLIRHGQDYAHLDLRNSYGAVHPELLRHELPVGRATRCSAAARCCCACR